MARTVSFLNHLIKLKFKNLKCKILLDKENYTQSQSWVLGAPSPQGREGTGSMDLIHWTQSHRCQPWVGELGEGQCISH